MITYIRVRYECTKHFNECDYISQFFGFDWEEKILENK